LCLDSVGVVGGREGLLLISRGFVVLVELLLFSRDVRELNCKWKLLIDLDYPLQKGVI